jgi:hypothetical protein
VVIGPEQVEAINWHVHCAKVPPKASVYGDWESQLLGPSCSACDTSVTISKPSCGLSVCALRTSPGDSVDVAPHLNRLSERPPVQEIVRHRQPFPIPLRNARLVPGYC